jgi:hypothetical protein
VRSGPHTPTTAPSVVRRPRALCSWGANLRAGGQLLPLSAETLARTYRHSKRRVILLGLDGTLIQQEKVIAHLKNFHDFQGHSMSPPPAALHCLRALTADPLNVVYVISARGPADMEARRAKQPDPRAPPPRAPCALLTGAACAGVLGRHQGPRAGGRARLPAHAPASARAAVGAAGADRRAGGLERPRAPDPRLVHGPHQRRVHAVARLGGPVVLPRLRPGLRQAAGALPHSPPTPPTAAPTLDADARARERRRPATSRTRCGSGSRAPACASPTRRSSAWWRCASPG